LAEVQLRGVSKVFPGGIMAVEPLDLTIPDGELFTLVGPSGSGKSTLLRMIAGLETPTTGTIQIGSRDVTRLPPRDRDVAMVFQQPALYPHLSVFKNLAFGLRAHRVPGAETRTRVEWVAERLGLTSVLTRKPRTLSGGQKQRVALGRAIVRRPSVFLLDEPMSSLDTPLRASIRSDLIDLQRTLNATMIAVTHDQGEALMLGHRVGVVERGRVVQIGRPEEVYQRPASRLVAEFVGEPPMNLLLCEIQEPDSDGRIPLKIVDFSDGSLFLDTSLRKPRGRILLGIRPECVAIAEMGTNRSPAWQWISSPADVVAVEFLGHERVTTIRLGSNLLKARVPGENPTRIGDRVLVGLDLRQACWFDDGA